MEVAYITESFEVQPRWFFNVSNYVYGIILVIFVSVKVVIPSWTVPVKLYLKTGSFLNMSRGYWNKNLIVHSVHGQYLKPCV